MGNLKQIQVKGMIVLTTEQIARAYETTPEKIRWNFKYNRNKYKQGKHFILIEGEELRMLKRECEFQTLFKQAKSVCLWTEKGALLHAKSLNTDKAWEVYDYLVDYYFRVQESPREVSVARQQSSISQVVDIPVNAKAQELIQEVRKDIAGLESVLSLYDRYETQEDHQKTKYIIQQLGYAIAHSTYMLHEFKPELVERSM